MTFILGISAFYHDSAATIIKDGKIISAGTKKKDLLEKKHDSGYPYNAVQFVLNNSNLKLDDIESIVFYEKPFLKFRKTSRNICCKCS